jgi:hypothetical protein
MATKKSSTGKSTRSTAKRSSGGRKYGAKAGKTVESAMRRRKSGTLRSGSGKKVTSREQAVAIGLSEAREKGAKVPPKPSGGKRKTAARKASGNQRATPRKSASRSTARTSGKSRSTRSSSARSSKKK